MDAVTLGAWLQAQRREAGLSLERLAEATKVSARFLDALERGDLDSLPTRVHARAFALAHARACGADDEDAIARVSAAMAPAAPAPPGSPLEAKEGAGPAPRGWRPPQRWKIWAVLGAASFGLFMGLHAAFQPGPPRPAAPEIPAAVLPALPSLPAPEAKLPPAPASQPAATPSADENVPDELGLRAKRPCWVVLEIDGKRLPTLLLERSEDARERYQVRQKAVLLAGNIGAVRIWWRGENLGYLGEFGQRMNGIVFEKGRPWRREPEAELALPPGVPSQASR